MRIISVSYCQLFLRFWLIISVSLLSLSSAQANTNSGPVGIYLLGPLDSNANIERIEDKDFVTGYNLRITWSTLEPVPGQYDFSLIDDAITELHASGKKMSISLFANSVPQYVLDNADTFVFGTGNASGRDVPVPWDSFAMSAYQALISQFANHKINVTDQNGDITEIALKNHPA